MKFFIPNVKASETETTHKAMAKLLQEQFRLPVMDRRIFSLRYTNSKKRWLAEVGCLEEQENHYEIVAIFESKQYMVVTRDKGGRPGITIMVDKDEVTAVEDFETDPAAAVA